MLQRVISDLRERRLWPLAVVLLVAIVAVPLVLAKSPGPAAPPPPAPLAAAGRPVRTSLPSVSVGASSSHLAVHSKPHNPFAPSKLAKRAKTAATHGSSATNGGASQSGASQSGGGTSSSSAGGSAGTGATGSPAAGGVPGSPGRIPSGQAKPGPIELRPDQAYDVTLAATRADGGLDTTPSLAVGRSRQ